MNIQELYQSVDGFLEALGYEEKSLIAVLQEIQEKYFHQQKLLSGMDVSQGMTAQRVLELNPNASAFAALQRAFEQDKDKAARYAQVLYYQSLLIAGLTLEDPAAYAELVCSLMD